MAEAGTAIAQRKKEKQRSQLEAKDHLSMLEGLLPHL